MPHTGRAGLRLLQDLRRSLLDPPRQLRPRTVAATRTTTAQRMSPLPLDITMNRNRAEPVPFTRLVTD
jgi:hypothetical protein